MAATTMSLPYLKDNSQVCGMSYQQRHKVSTIQVVLKNVCVEDSLEMTARVYFSSKGEHVYYMV